MGIYSTFRSPSQYANITTATTTQVKTGSGFLERVNVGTPVNGGTVALYDHTSSTTNPIGIIKSDGTALAAPGGFSVEFNVSFSNGLRVVTTGAQNVTIVYR